MLNGQAVHHFVLGGSYKRRLCSPPQTSWLGIPAVGHAAVLSRAKGGMAKEGFACAAWLIGHERAICDFHIVPWHRVGC